MRPFKTGRGFGGVEHEMYPGGEPKAVVMESSAVGEYEDSLERPGSSFLWIGDHHLNRDEVKVIVDRIQRWLDSGRLLADEEITE